MLVWHVSVERIDVKLPYLNILLDPEGNPYSPICTGLRIGNLLKA